MRAPRETFDEWFSALERRHLADLTFVEVRRAVQALSWHYVERRRTLGVGAALAGRGKRAAFALFYAPLHFLTVERVARAVTADSPAPDAVLDLGCGTGTGGAGWAVAAANRPRLFGVDRNPWALAECRWNWNRLGLNGTTHRAQLARFRPSDLPAFDRQRRRAVLAAFVVNELGSEERSRWLKRLTQAARHGTGVLIVEPIARKATPWWDDWGVAFSAHGARRDEWRFPVDLPPGLRELDRAAGLDHRELTARSLYVAPGR